ncbi:DUF72 domain-containing protein [Asanoa sp. WMMD1127]|uniref:DUF72 domain-containing protein n=1 Tax=Asanoa sp. WMMD1127 TaxID=3016107 RepID=UPI002417268C|nr:DUF72 domain-containing protein [Asanoa sp. WMMD1127]MDG4820528.1 DUF72 domain-containing protein [Asanoa sp. WMMD1127]
MWTLKSWHGRFLPERSTERLRSYAEWCDAVEGNTTFYATPARSTVESWAAQTDPDFRFVVKLPREITHERRLAECGEPLRAFLDAIEPLGPRTHALWIQLPGSFGPADIGTLAAFLRRLPAFCRYAVEVRHTAFFNDRRAGAALEQALALVAAEWIPFDTTAFFARPPTSAAEREAWSKKPRMPLRTRALTQFPIVRYLGRDAADATVDGWQRWVETTAGWLREGRSPTVFVHTPDNADAPALARRFHAEVRARVPDLRSLPEPVPSTLF